MCAIKLKKTKYLVCTKKKGIQGALGFEFNKK